MVEKITKLIGTLLINYAKAISTYYIACPILDYRCIQVFNALVL